MVSSTRSLSDASERLTKAVVALKLDKPRLLTGMIEISTELKTSVADIMEHTQALVELDTSWSTSQPREESTNESREESTPTSETRERSSSISFLLTSKDKLKVKAKNVRLTTRELAQTLRKYSFLSEGRTGESKHRRGICGTPISNGISTGLRDRTNSPVSFQRKIFHSKESPL
jgi:hypothetical protein